MELPKDEASGSRDTGVRFVASSARRHLKRPVGPGIWAAVGVIALVLVVVLLGRKPSQESGPGPQPPTSVPVAARPSPSPSPGPPGPPGEPSPAIEIVSAWEETAPAPTGTPTPLPTWAPPQRPTPTPTPAIQSCVQARWSARQGVVRLGEILVDIDAENRCGRNLGPLDVWFRITGWRHGNLVQTVTGHPFDPIEDGHTGSLTIGLPGSLDWYDRITVEVLGPDES